MLFEKITEKVHRERLLYVVHTFQCIEVSNKRMKVNDNGKECERTRGNRIKKKQEPNVKPPSNQIY